MDPNSGRIYEQRLILESQARELGKVLAGECPAGVGFALLIFDFGETGNLAYVSNGERADVVKAIEELLERLRVPS